MSVDTHTRTPPAGSQSINSPPAASSDAQAALTDPGDAQRQDGTAEGWSAQSNARMPSRDRLAWVCDRCTRRIVGTGAGMAVIDLRETDAAARGQLRSPDGPVKARWRVYHAECASECVKPMNPYFRIWLDRVGNVDDLLDAVAELSRLPWFGWSDWGGSLVRKVLADTGKTIDESVALREQRAQRRRRNAREDKRLPPEDERCGSDRGYHAGCGCQRCRAAHNEVARRNKEKQRRRRAEAQS